MTVEIWKGFICLLLSDSLKRVVRTIRALVSFAAVVAMSDDW